MCAVLSGCVCEGDSVSLLLAGSYGDRRVPVYLYVSVCSIRIRIRKTKLSIFHKIVLKTKNLLILSFAECYGKETPAAMQK